jgi:hypothetical protein
METESPSAESFRRGAQVVVGLGALVLVLGMVACRQKLAAPAPPTRALPPLPVATATPEGTLFFDGFSTDRGWTYGPEWQRGAATASVGHGYGYPDPALDHSEGGDNFLAGAVIGGNVTTEVHDFYFLTSPALDASGWPTLHLTYWRWYNGDYLNYMEGVVEVWDGTAWVRIFSTGNAPGVTDPGWAFQSFDITPYRNPRLQVRFGHQVLNSGAFFSSGWNLDDVLIGRNAPPVPSATATPTPSPTWTPSETPTPTTTGQCGVAMGTCTFTETPTFSPTFTETRTPTLTPTCMHPVTVLGDALIPNHTPDAVHPLVIGTPALVSSQAECETYSPGNPFCAGVDYGQSSLILYQASLCYNSFLVTGVTEDCLGGLIVDATCTLGCPVCCSTPPDHRYTLIPRTTRPIGDVHCTPP